MSLDALLNTGRNQPCLCGSGKKYKRCCLIRMIRSTRPDSICQSTALALHAARGFDCLLCAAPPQAVALFVPTPAALREMGVTDGQGKAVAYSLCRSCALRPDRAQEVERRVVEAAGLVSLWPEAGGD